MSDKRVPQADTLRNQGWLQSGLLYPANLFQAAMEFRRIGVMSYFGGRRMLAQCEMEPSADRAIVKVSEQSRIDLLVRRAQIMRWKEENFRRLDSAEAKAKLGELHESGATYYLCPDAPFDEASVLQHLRDAAIATGAACFCETDDPVALSRNSDALMITCGRATLESPVTLVAAGASNVALAQQIMCDLPASLRQTPLLVHAGPVGFDAPIVVDLDRGFAAVRHPCEESNGAIVIGTKVHQPNASFVSPPRRRISRQDTERFRSCLHPALEIRVARGRFTAGFELMPAPPAQVSFVEPFVQSFGNVVFASPGRATIALKAAEHAFAEVLRIIEARGRSRFRFQLQETSRWSGPINMHYRPEYGGLNDVEP
jgi:hypothetical protein